MRTAQPAWIAGRDLAAMSSRRRAPRLGCSAIAGSARVSSRRWPGPAIESCLAAMRGSVVAFACLSALVLWLGPGVASSSRAPQCRTAQLSVLQAGVDGAASHEGLVVRLTNRSSRPCLIGGYVGLLRLDVHRRPVHTVVHRGSGYLFRSSRPHNIILAPGHSVFAGVEWIDGPVDNDPTSCTSAGHDLEVTPPNETTHATIYAPTSACASGRLSTTALQVGRSGQGAEHFVR